jgi:GntR family transcriptional repressor for pyruvate dehydrogenase complex
LSEPVAQAIIVTLRADGCRPGTLLPPLADLVRRLDVSRSVVREAIDLLVARSVVGPTRGRRWVVLSLPGTEEDQENHASPGAALLRPPALGDRVADEILRLVMARNLREGDALPSAGELARSFGVSVLVVREALARLAAWGALARRQGREPVVANPTAQVISSIMSLRGHLEQISIDELQLARAGLERIAGSLAAASPDRVEGLAALREHLEGMRAAAGAAEFNTHDMEFHLALARMSGNRAVAILLEALNDLVRDALQVLYGRVEGRRGKQGVRATLEVHQQIVERIAAGDVAGTTDAVDEHFSYAAWASGPGDEPIVRRPGRRSVK